MIYQRLESSILLLLAYSGICVSLLIASVLLFFGIMVGVITEALISICNTPIWLWNMLFGKYYAITYLFSD